MAVVLFSSMPGGSQLTFRLLLDLRLLDPGRRMSTQHEGVTKGLIQVVTGVNEQRLPSIVFTAEQRH